MPLEPHDPITITLGRSNVLNPELLVEPAWDTLGAEPDLELDNVEIRIGSRPQAFDLARLYTANRRDVPDLFRSTLDGFRLWLIAYSISVLRTPGKRRVESVSFEVAFPASPRVTVTDVFPKPIFINHLAIRPVGCLSENSH